MSKPEILNSHLRLLILLLLINGVFTLRSQDLLFHNFTSANGLLSSDNYGVTQDKKGYIWIFSESGVLKYDGYKFRSFKSLNGLVSNDVWDIQVDSENRKWLYYYGRGIQYIKNDKVHTVSGTNPLIQYFYVGEHEDTVFFKGGSSSFGDFKRYYWTPGEPIKRYHNSLRSNVNLLVDFRELGWKLFVKGNEQFLQNIRTGRIDTLEFQLKSISGTIILDHHRLFKSNKTETVYWIDKNGLHSKIEKNLSGASFENVFSEARTGHVILKKSKFEVYSNYEKQIRNKKLEFLLNEFFESPLQMGNLFLDNEENLWVTKRRGEIYLFPKFWKLIGENTIELSDLDKNVISPTMLRENLLFQTKSNKLYSLNTLSNTVYAHQNDLPATTIRRIKTKENKLFIHASTKFIVANLSPNGEILSIEKKMLIRASNDFDFISNDSILLGNGDLLLLNSQKIEENYINLPIRVSNLLKSKRWLVYSLNTGVEAVNLDTKRKLKFAISNVTFIKNVNGKIIIGTKGGGCHFLNGNMERISNYLDGFEINDIARFKDDWFVSTNRGLILVHFIEAEMNIKNVYFGQKKLGIQINSAFLVMDKIYLFTSNGVKVIDQSLLNDKSFDLDFKISKIKVNDVKKNRSNLSFEAGSNYLEVNLSSVSYWNLEELYFRYKLHGNQKRWITTQEKVLKFNNLPPGNYRLEVGVSNFPVGKFSKSKFLEFEVLPTFISKWWVKALLIFTFLLLMIAVAIIVRKIVTDREKRARDLKSLKLKAITAQLNPHFVFNSLNTIQSLVMLRSEYEANKYIGAFAGLMRKVLDSSMTETILLKHEIQFLNNYLELENQRLNESLHYSITCSKAMNENSIFIYSMVFQPIVENAIVHGLLNKKGDKILTIDFHLDEDTLVGKITDNGIGRQASSEINKNKINKSWSSTILKEKMLLLNHRNKKELEVEIIDLNENGTNSGTQVIVKMKIQGKD